MIRKSIFYAIFLTHSEVSQRLEISIPQESTAMLLGREGICRKQIAGQMLQNAQLLLIEEKSVHRGSFVIK